MADLIPVTFNEGEPLDVSKLNNLRLNQVTTYQIASSLQNSTIDGKTVPMIDYGSVNVTISKVGSNGPVALPINANFVGTPTFIVSIGGGEIGSAMVSPRVVSATKDPGVIVQSSAALNKTIQVNYIAVQNKSV
jgi:hypothetical protein